MNYFVIFGISLLFLALAANLLVKFTEGLSSSTKLSPLVLGATAVACGTSIPEFSVAISSILQGVPSLSLGDIVGSNIANVALILGLGILLFPVRIGTEKTQRNNLILIFLTFFFVALYLFPPQIRKSWALGLVIFYPIFLFLELFWGVDGSKHEDKKALKKMKKTKLTPLANLAGIGLSLAGLSISSKFLVSSAVGIASFLKVENEVIGLSMVAVGTSIPELFTSIIAGFRKDWKLLLGDIQGSNIFNLSIIGAFLILLSNGVGRAHNVSLIYLLSIAVIIFLLTIRYAGRSIPRIFGLIFLLIYASYIYLIAR